MGQSHPEKDPMGSFLYPFEALGVGLDNRAMSNLVSSGGPRVYSLNSLVRHRLIVEPYPEGPKWIQKRPHRILFRATLAHNNALAGAKQRLVILISMQNTLIHVTHN